VTHGRGSVGEAGKWSGYPANEKRQNITACPALLPCNNYDVHTSPAKAWLSWHHRRFEWTGPFLWKTKSSLCAWAITFLSCYTATASRENRLWRQLPVPTLTTSFRGVQTIFLVKTFHVRYPTLSTAVTLHTYSPMKMEQFVPKLWNLNHRPREITHNKAQDNQNKARVWNHGSV
jgi:hypothetical protein